MTKMPQQKKATQPAGASSTSVGGRTGMNAVKKLPRKSPPSAKEKTEINVNKQSLQAVINQINKSLGGTGKVYLADEHPEIARIQTGILGLDIITGGGIPRGVVTELYGAESSGKSLLASLIIAHAQNHHDGHAFWLKQEGIDKSWVLKLGVDLRRLYLIETGNGDTGLETCVTLFSTGAIDIGVLDSVQAVGTSRELSNSVESESYGGGGAAQLWGRMMRATYAAQNAGAAKDTAIILISQVRDVIGGFSKHKPSPKPTGIHAILHWKGISIECKRGDVKYANENTPEKKRVVAREFHLRCAKNKTAGTEGRATSFWFYYDEVDGVKPGVDTVEQVMRYGQVYDLIESNGAWLSGYGLKGQGREQYLRQLRDRPDLVDQIYADVMQRVKEE